MVPVTVTVLIVPPEIVPPPATGADVLAQTRPGPGGRVLDRRDRAAERADRHVGVRAGLLCRDGAAHGSRDGDRVDRPAGNCAAPGHGADRAARNRSGP